MKSAFEFSSRFPRAQVAVRATFLASLGLNVVARNFYRPPRVIKYLRARARPEGMEVQVSTREQGAITLLLPDTASSMVYLGLPFDLDVFRFFDHVTVPGMVALDVGANIGLMSRGLARRVGPEGRVVAFEPVPLLNDLLHRNVRDLAQVSVVSAAIGATAGEIDLRWYGLRWASQTSVGDPAVIGYRGQRVPKFVSLRVPAQTLDDWRGSFDRRVDVIKVDVEGAELEVLSGAKALLTDDRPWLIVEVTSMKAVDFCLSLGYSVVACPDDRGFRRLREACRRGLTGWPVNVLFSPR